MPTTTRPPKFVRRSILPVLAATALLATGCSSESSADAATPERVIETYAEGVEASYKKSLDSARVMDAAIDAFIAAPSEGTLSGARQAWLAARNDYGRTEGFRFYGGPIDNEETGKEGQINAWPLDEQYIDYVEGQPNAGIVNNVAQFPTLDAEVIAEQNEKDGEANISTGWHAIEFLLWGQDLSESGPGARPATDYTTAANADRRKTYLATVTTLLISDLGELVSAWAPDADNYRKELLAAEPNEALRRMITGIGELSRGELSGERLSTAFMDRSQEDEHSCFSDNTTNDVIANADAVRMVVEGDYGNVQGPGFADLVATENKELADRLSQEVQTSVTSAKAIPTPFDAALREGVPDTDPSRTAIQRTMDDLDTQTDTIVEAANALGVTIQVS